MKSKDTILLAVAVLLLIGAGVVTARWFQKSAADTADFPEGTFWLCNNPACQAEFVKKMEELAEFYRANPDGALPCPKCGKTETVRARRCPNCKHFYAAPAPGRAVQTCPHCKQALPRLTERG